MNISEVKMNLMWDIKRRSFIDKREEREQNECLSGSCPLFKDGPLKYLVPIFIGGKCLVKFIREWRQKHVKIKNSSLYVLKNERKNKIVL